MTEIEVTPEQLGETAGRIERAVSAGDLLASQCPAGPGVSAAGRADVAGAIDLFLDAWRYGLSHLDHDAGHLASLLRQAGDAYEQTDAAIGRAS